MPFSSYIAVLAGRRKLAKIRTRLHFEAGASHNNSNAASQSAPQDKQQHQQKHQLHATAGNDTWFQPSNAMFSL